MPVLAGNLQLVAQYVSPSAAAPTEDGAKGRNATCATTISKALIVLRITHSRASARIQTS